MILDPRRAEGKLYKIALHFAVFHFGDCDAGQIVPGHSNVYQDAPEAVEQSLQDRLEETPAHTAIRYILQGLDPAEVETIFRERAANLDSSEASTGKPILAFDGKALKSNFDAFNAVKARQMLGAFAGDTALVPAHIEIEEKPNEIPAVQKLLEELDVAGEIITLHATQTFEAAAEAQAHLIVLLKDNQPTLCREVETVYNDAKTLSAVQTVVPFVSLG
jgi:hypothetical protein